LRCSRFANGGFPIQTETTAFSRYITKCTETRHLCVASRSAGPKSYQNSPSTASLKIDVERKG
jgi:hypothetical protein